MFEVGLILVFFAILPASLGYITNALNSPAQRSWYATQWATLKAWQALDYARALFVLCAALLYVAGGSAYLGMKLSMPLALTLMIATSLSALLYLWVFADMTQKVNSYEQRIKFSLGLIVISIATASKIYSDAGIAELTGLPPQELPGAQLLLTFILTPVIWLVMTALLIGYLSIPGTIYLLARGIYLDVRKKAGSPGKYVLASIALSFLSLTLLTMTKKLLDKEFYEKRLREAVVFASFNLPPAYCGLPNQKGSSIAPLGDGKAALAMPDEKLGFTFRTLDCEPKSQPQEELTVLLNNGQKQELTQ